MSRGGEAPCPDGEQEEERAQDEQGSDSAFDYMERWRFSIALL